MIEKMLDDLVKWAKSTGEYRVTLGKPMTKKEITGISKIFKPYFGTLDFAPPPVYSAFLKKASSLKVSKRIVYYPGTEYQSFEWEPVIEIYSPKKAAQVTRGTVHMPKGVSDDKGVLTTNHLIGFAATEASPDCTWCFLTDKKSTEGEYAVVYHDQDSPYYAKYFDTGKYMNPGDVKPDYKNFIEWFKSRIKKLRTEKK